MAAELATSLTVTDADRLMQAEQAVRNYCGWHIAPSRDETVTLRPDCRDKAVLLPSLHVTAIASISADEVDLEVDSYRWSANGVIKADCGYWWQDELVVEFTHGYATPPADVAAIVIAIAQRGVDNPSSLVRTQAGPFADTYSQTGFNQSLPIALLDAERSILDFYRIPPRP